MKSRVSGYKMAHAKKPHARLGGRRAQRKGGMTVQNIKRFVEHVKMDHEERLQDIRIQMKSLPPGDLIFARKNQKYSYYYNGASKEQSCCTRIAKSWHSNLT